MNDLHSSIKYKHFNMKNELVRVSIDATRIRPMPPLDQ